MTAASLSLADYERMQPACTVTHGGQAVHYMTPNQITKWRVDTLFTKEPDTMAWIETFQPEDVLVDIGANVGMYTIWAAMTRAVQVFAFEPESQNYALLNHNIVANGCADRVTAWCMALSDQSGFDRFYLGEFGIGGSCHAYGEALDPNLKPRSSKHIQGSFAARLDELVAGGVVTQPNHVKIDVDGFEHKVIAGAAETLRSPELKSVLIEINHNLAEHQALIEQMADLGFCWDQNQIDSSMQKEGAFAGSGNMIFWKSEQAARELGDTLVGAQSVTSVGAGQSATTASGQPRANGAGDNTIAGFTVDGLFEAVKSVIESAPVIMDPTPHWYAETIFPSEFYEELLDRLPADENYTPITDLGWAVGGSEAQRGLIPFNAQGLASIPDDLRDFWIGLATIFNSEEFALTMLRKYLPQLAERFGDDLNRLSMTKSAMLVRDRTAYALGPHTDIPHRIVVGLLYLPRDNAMEHLGTSFYRPKDPDFRCAGGPHYEFEDFERVSSVPFRPNAMFSFFKTDTSFHGVEPVNDVNVRRDLMSYIIEGNT